MPSPSDYEKVPLVGTAAEIEGLIATTPDGWDARRFPLVPGDKQLVVESDTGTMKVGDGQTVYADLSALPGGGGGASLTFPSGSGGIKDGFYGVEYDGNAIALSAETLDAVFDTVYSDLESGDSAALTDPVEVDDWTLATTGITPKFTGAAWLYMEFDTDGPTAARVHINWHSGSGTSATGYEVPVGGEGAALPPTLVPVVEGRELSFLVQATADETASYVYAQIAVCKAAEAS